MDNIIELPKKEYNNPLCQKCGKESYAGVCQGCQEVESCCDCEKYEIKKEDREPYYPHDIF